MVATDSGIPKTTNRNHIRASLIEQCFKSGKSHSYVIRASSTVPASIPTIPTVQFRGRTLWKHDHREWKRWKMNHLLLECKVMYPWWGIRPKVGFKPITPQRAAGILTEPIIIYYATLDCGRKRSHLGFPNCSKLPPPSTPSATGHSPAATTAADPLEDPPAILVVSYGFLTVLSREPTNHRDSS